MPSVHIFDVLLFARSRFHLLLGYLTSTVTLCLDYSTYHACLSVIAYGAPIFTVNFENSFDPPESHSGVLVTHGNPYKIHVY